MKIYYIIIYINIVKKLIIRIKTWNKILYTSTILYKELCIYILQHVLVYRYTHI